MVNSFECVKMHGPTNTVIIVHRVVFEPGSCQVRRLVIRWFLASQSRPTNNVSSALSSHDLRRSLHPCEYVYVYGYPAPTFHVLLWYTWSAGTFAFTQTAYLLKLVIPTTNALSSWRLNVETKTKRTLHSTHRLSFNELTNAKNLLLHSSHFAINWRCCTAVR